MLQTSALAATLLVAAFLSGNRATQQEPVAAPGAAEDPWLIPPEASARLNPVARSRLALSKARELWHAHCETCHGRQGRGDGPNARLHEQRKKYKPRDLTDPAVQENLTDGDILWRVTRGIVEEGEIIMPAYEEKVPSETDRWRLVLYVRQLGSTVSR